MGPAALVFLPSYLSFTGTTVTRLRIRWSLERRRKRACRGKFELKGRFHLLIAISDLSFSIHASTAIDCQQVSFTCPCYCNTSYLCNFASYVCVFRLLKSYIQYPLYLCFVTVLHGGCLFPKSSLPGLQLDPLLGGQPWSVVTYRRELIVIAMLLLR